MRTAIYLEQHPLLGHPWSAAPVLGWSALPWAGLARPHQNPPYGGTGQPQSLSVGQQFAQVGMVDALIAFLGQGHSSTPFKICNRFCSLALNVSPFIN